MPTPKASYVSSYTTLFILLSNFYVYFWRLKNVPETCCSGNQLVLFAQLNSCT